MKKGFTLIELMLVVAIIGILSAIVLVALGESRKRAADAKVKAQITHGKAAAEVYFGINQNYGAQNFSLGQLGGSCAGSMYTDIESGMYRQSSSANYPGGTVLVCVQNFNHFAFAGSLSQTDQYWCVDSSGDPGIVQIDNLGLVDGSDDSCAKLEAK